MTVQTQINKEWAVRLLLILVMATAFGGWFVYDGAYAWPIENKKAQIAFSDIAQRQTYDDWQQRLTNAGYKPSSTPPKYREPLDIKTQFLYAAICAAGAISVLVVLLGNTRKKLSCDDQGIRRGSLFVPFSAITSIDKVRWDSKGIAVVYYKADDGSEARLKLDDWVYKGAAQILEQAEQHLTPDPATAEKQSA